MKYQYWQDKTRVWCWHLKGGDGEVVAHGEGYVDEPEVLRAIDLARQSRPADGDVRHSRRYRLSFAALLALVAAAFLSWAAVEIVLPRWDGSWVIVDAAVIAVSSHGSGKRRTEYTAVRFAALDGRVISTTVRDSPQKGATAARVRYNPRNPKEALLDANITPYVIVVTILIVVFFFLRLAYLASLHDGQKHFM